MSPGPHRKRASHLDFELVCKIRALLKDDQPRDVEVIAKLCKASNYRTAKVIANERACGSTDVFRVGGWASVLGRGRPKFANGPGPDIPKPTDDFLFRRRSVKRAVEGWTDPDEGKPRVIIKPYEGMVGKPAHPFDALLKGLT